MPTRSVIAFTLVGLLCILTVCAAVLLFPRHKMLAVGVIGGLLALIGWVVFILPAYWD